MANSTIPFASALISDEMRAVCLRYVNRRNLPSLPKNWEVTTAKRAADLLHHSIPKGCDVAILLHHKDLSGVLVDYKHAIFLSSTDPKRKAKLAASKEDVYEQRLYFPEGFPRGGIPDGARVHRCESALKAERLTLLGYIAVGANGMDGYWHDGGRPIPDYIQLLSLQTRSSGQSVTVFDAPKLASAESRQRTESSIRRMCDYEHITSGTPPLVARIPPNLNGKDSVGIDDVAEEQVRTILDNATLYQTDPANYLQQLPDDWASKPPDEAAAIIAGVLICRSMVLSAPGWMRKTTFSVHIAVQVILEQLLFGRNPSATGAVLIVTAEDEFEDTHRTLARFDTNLTPDQAKKVRDNLYVLDVNTIPSIPQLLTRTPKGCVPGELFDHVESILRAHPDIVLIIFDTYSSLGGVEDSNADAAVFHRAANRLCHDHELGTLTLHHASQVAALSRTVSEYATRGVTALVDNARAVLQLVRETGTPDDLRYPAPPLITADERAGRVASTVIYRLHVHRIRWSPKGGETAPDRPFFIAMRGWHITTYDCLPPGNEPLAAQAVNDEADTTDVRTLLTAIRGAPNITRKMLVARKLPAAPNTRSRVAYLGKDRINTLLAQMLERTPPSVREVELGGAGNPIGLVITKAGGHVLEPQY